MTNTRINPTLAAWFKKATPEDREAYLANGKVTVGQFLNKELLDVRYGPILRGFVINRTDFPTHKAALVAGSDYLKRLRSKQLRVLDEAALGISDTNSLYSEAANDLTIRAEKIIHIGLSISDSDALPDVLKEFIDELDESKGKALEKTMPGIVEVGKRDTYEEREAFFVEMVFRHDLMGYLVCMSTPVMTHNFSEGKKKSKSASYTWGYYKSSWFYAETMDKVMQQVRNWVKKIRKAELDNDFSEYIAKENKQVKAVARAANRKNQTAKKEPAKTTKPESEKTQKANAKKGQP